MKNFQDIKNYLISKYVNSSLFILKKAVSPVVFFMRHLLVVQGIDPETQPGQRLREALFKALDRKHEESYDKDFNYNPVRPSFKLGKKLQVFEDSAERVIEDLMKETNESLSSNNVTEINEKDLSTAPIKSSKRKSSKKKSKK